MFLFCYFDALVVGKIVKGEELFISLKFNDIAMNRFQPHFVIQRLSCPPYPR